MSHGRSRLFLDLLIDEGLKPSLHSLISRGKNSRMSQCSCVSPDSSSSFSLFSTISSCSLYLFFVLTYPLHLSHTHILFPPYFPDLTLYFRSDCSLPLPSIFFSDDFPSLSYFFSPLTLSISLSSAPSHSLTADRSRQIRAGKRGRGRESTKDKPTP